MTKLTLRLWSIVLLSALSAAALFAPAHAVAQSPAAPRGRQKTEHFNGREVAAGQVIVKFSKSAAPQAVEHAKAAADVEADRAVGGRGARLFKSRSKNVEALVRELSARGDVVYAEPNYVIRLTAAPDDPRFGEQWALQNTGYTASTGPGTPGADIGAVSAWDVSTGSRANVVAVVDTGIDYNHPDLAANVWSAPAAFTVNIAGQTITCAAGSHGFDALTNTCDPLDDNNHGTHVAGTVGAVGNNGVGVSGVSQTASIMGLRFIDAQGAGTLEGAINAIEFAVQAKQVFGAGANVRVLSNSWGWNGDASQALLDQINRVAASDMLFVAGAGNSGADNDAAPFYPANYEAPNVVSVAATDNNDALVVASSWASNYGRNSVDLAAPGNLVLSTVVGGSYDWFSGTSMATPHVSGAAALVLSRCALDTAGLKGALLSNIDQIPSLSAVTATGGRLNVDKAIRSCTVLTPSPTSTPAPSASPTPAANSAPTVALTGPAGGATFTAPASITLSASASDADGVVNRVDFYAGTQLIGTDYTHPYTLTWGNVGAGTYSLSAVAADERGAVTTSATVSIYVNHPPAPSAGTGTTGRLAKWSDGGAGTLGDSAVVEAGGNLGLGTATPANRLDVVRGAAGQMGKGIYEIASFEFDGDAKFGIFSSSPSAPSAALTFGATARLVGGGRFPGFEQQYIYGATAAANQMRFNYIERTASGHVTNFAANLLSINGDGSVTLNPVGAGVAASPRLGVGTSTPQSTLQVNGYLQLGLASGAPPAADCDAEAEYGRMKVDAVSVKLYVCTSAGWKSAALQ